MRIINRWGPNAGYKIQRAGTNLVLDEGTLLSNQVFLTLRLDPSARYFVTLSYPPIGPSYFRFTNLSDLGANAEIELRVDNPFRSPELEYEKYYSLFMTGDAQLYLSWAARSRFWAYLYDGYKVLWFSTESDTGGGGALHTGTPLRIRQHTRGPRSTLTADDPSRNVWWDQGASTGRGKRWRLWRQDQPSQPGLPIRFGQPLMIESVDFPGSFIYRSRKDPNYLLIGAATAGTSSFQLIPGINPGLADNFPVAPALLSGEP
jgi:hypothetical protein